MNNYPKGSDDNSYSRQTFWLEPKEYSKIVSEINNLYDSVYKGKRLATHTSFGIDGIAYIYWFENHGFNNYNIYFRTIDNH